MNAVEIEMAVSELALAPFDADNFAWAFLAAFGNRETTIKRLQKGGTNLSDVPGGVLQRNNIHLCVCAADMTGATLADLRASPKTRGGRVKFILATDGALLEAEELTSGETLVCPFGEMAQHFGFFLPLAGISTIREIKDNPIDIRATGRVNKLYVELIKDNPQWANEQGRSAMNHFMARLIFCFYAEDTDIFNGAGLFTQTIEQMSEKDGSNTAWVIAEIFRAMNIAPGERAAAKLPNWADAFPHVNGGLFSGDISVPSFSKAARTHLINAGHLDWREINPDIFGSMIQAVADEDERGALGMHYTSVPNILKVLNPLFLDELRAQLEAAGDSPQKLLNLRKRLARIRIFDPACGSGNFLVIAYKQLREIEAQINRRRGEPELNSMIPIGNFRGIEIRDFPAQIARLALIIAKYQCDVRYIGQKNALDDFLPLDKENWITCGNALRLDWLSLCPPWGTAVKTVSNDLLQTELAQPEIDFENEGGEVYICGNPPYKGSQWQEEEQKDDLRSIFEARSKYWKSMDYVSGWFMKAADYGRLAHSAAAFVSTNSICQGRQVATLWPLIFKTGQEIIFAHTSFKWANLASFNAGVTVVVVGLSNRGNKQRFIYSETEKGGISIKQVEQINAYLAPGSTIVVDKRNEPFGELARMSFGNMPNDGGHLLLTPGEARMAMQQHGVDARFIRPFVGSEEYINGKEKRCIWVNDDEYIAAQQNSWLQNRFELVAQHRLASERETTNELAQTPYKFGEVRQRENACSIIVPRVSSESRQFLPCGYLSSDTIVADAAFALFDAPLWNLAIIASRLHLVWIATVCGKLKTDFRYSNTLGWNTFPVPKLTSAEKQMLAECAAGILLAREMHFPATLAELYAPDAMPENLALAHASNDTALEHIYLGRRFKNDSERLEHLFARYTEMSAKSSAGAARAPAAKAAKAVLAAVQTTGQADRAA